MEEKKGLTWKPFKEWLDDKSEQAKWKIHCAAEWCKNHKETIIVFGPVIMGGIIEICKISTKRHTVKEEKALKDRYIYDRSTGHYYELKRKPKTSEWLQIEQRKQNGESLGWILNDMGLLK